MTYTGRWHPDPDPRQAEHDAVDEQRRQAEHEHILTDAVYVGEDENDPQNIQI